MHRTILSAGSSALLLFAVCLACAGCSPPPRTVEVVGRVTREGKPVARALIVFYSTHRDDPPGYAMTDSEGRYYLQTFFSSHDIARGAVPDRDYVITVDKTLLPNNEKFMRGMAAVSAEGGDMNRYFREQALRDLWPDGVPENWPLDFIPGNSTVMKKLTDEMRAGVPGAKERLHKMQQSVHLVPPKYSLPTTSGLKATVEVSKKPQVFDFDLVGEPDPTRIRPWSEITLPGSEESEPTSGGKAAEDVGTVSMNARRGSGER